MTTVDNAKRQEMMFLGRECHHPACHLHDFLPFECPACHLSFCQPHFLPSVHSCSAPLPPSMVDRIAPQCPLCHEVVPYAKSSQDPNEAVERHILAGTCVAMEGGEARKRAELRQKKERGQVCWKRNCIKVLVVPMKCEACGRSFCPTHRHGSSHSCGAAAGTGSGSSSRSATPQPSSSTTKTPASNLVPKSTLSRLLPTASTSTASSSAPVKAHAPSQPIAQQLDARAAAAAAAMRRAGQDVKVPFVKTKTEKRAQDELASTIQALKARHDKGLLSQAEELKYAELVGKKEAARRKGGKDKDGCVVG